MVLAGFDVCCALPTAGVALWSVSWSGPSHVEAEARRLERTLGMSVTLERVEHPHPGAVRYVGLELAERETGRTVLRCPTVEAEWKEIDDEAGDSRNTLVLVASEPEIEAAGLESLGELLQRMFRRQMSPAEVDVRLVAGRATLCSGETTQAFSDLQASVRPAADGIEGLLDFRIVGHDTPEVVRVYMKRNGQADPPALHCEFYTGGGLIPCRVLKEIWPVFDRLGPKSLFGGHLRLVKSEGVWAGELAGRVDRVDLDALSAGRFPHRITGTAQLTVRHARFGRGRLERIDGTLVAGPGNVGRSLIDAAVSELGWRLGMATVASSGMLPYEQLAFDFFVDGGGLQVRGCGVENVDGIILTDPSGLLLGAPTVQPQPLTALARMAGPRGAAQVPATHEAQWLVRWLPQAGEAATDHLTARRPTPGRSLQ